MSLERNRNSITFQPIIVLALFFFYQPLFSQNPAVRDTIIKVPRGSFLQFRNIKKFLLRDTVINVSGALIPGLSLHEDKTVAFYDSLKAKASKSLLTRTLFDLVIVSPDTIDKKRRVISSQETFREYSGKRIRKINIQRLNVFGTSLNNPGYYNPNSTERLLNSTHINTNENIIKKYLLFSEGDTISPLKLSDNERIIRQLPFIDDSRIIVVPVSSTEADIIVVTKDVYSLGGGYAFRSKRNGTVSIYDKNIFGMGHEFGIDIPYSTGSPDSPGIGLRYSINNIWKTFINLGMKYSIDAFGNKYYGINLSKELISSTTKYAGGVTINQTFTTIDFAPFVKPEPKQPMNLSYQDFWLMRSFLLDRESVTRLIAGIRYINNNVLKRPPVDANSYHELQNYNFIIGSANLSIRKFYKTSLLYSYGRTEDIPYGMMLRINAGKEYNEFRNRIYSGFDISFGQFVRNVGYFYTSAGAGTFFNGSQTEQGMFLVRVKYFSDLVYLGSYRIRNFVNVDYTRGFDRYDDEYLVVPKTNGFSGLSNVFFRGNRRTILSCESVVFSPSGYLGFKYAFFGFTDIAFIAGTRKVKYPEGFLSGIGIGLRIRNDNLVLNTLQLRIGIFPNPPLYSRITNIIASGEQLLHPANFDPGPPSVIPYR